MLCFLVATTSWLTCGGGRRGGGGGEVPDQLQASTAACIIRSRARGLSPCRDGEDGVHMFTVCSLTPPETSLFYTLDLQYITIQPFLNCIREEKSCKKDKPELPGADFLTELYNHLHAGREQSAAISWKAITCCMEMILH